MRKTNKPSTFQMRSVGLFTPVNFLFDVSNLIRAGFIRKDILKSYYSYLLMEIQCVSRTSNSPHSIFRAEKTCSSESNLGASFRRSVFAPCQCHAQAARHARVVRHEARGSLDVEHAPLPGPGGCERVRRFSWHLLRDIFGWSVLGLGRHRFLQPVAYSKALEKGNISIAPRNRGILRMGNLY